MQAKMSRMRPEEYQTVPEDFWREVGSNQEQMNKGKGKYSVILHCVKTPVAEMTGSVEDH
jgi:hypothetical protein